MAILPEELDEEVAEANRKLRTTLTVGVYYGFLFRDLRDRLGWSNDRLMAELLRALDAWTVQGYDPLEEDGDDA